MFLYKWSEAKENLIEALNIGWKGILALFLGMAIIFILIFILNKITNKKAK
ncbi:unknown [Coprobacillus sp. CAG:698]|nr:unknown [Coprobacillus sp. CAG:698]